MSSGDDAILYMLIRGKAVTDNIPTLFELFEDILLNANLNNQKRAIEMLKESKIRKESSILSNGHSFGASRLAGRHSFMGYMGEVTGGLTSVRGAGALLENAEKDWPALQARLEQLRTKIIRKGSMIVNLTGDKKVLQSSAATIKSFIDSLPSAAIEKGIPLVEQFNAKKQDKLLPLQNEGFAMPSQVNYVVYGGPIQDPGDEVKGSSAVVSRYLSIGHLWDNVRVIGGAYGGFARFSELTGRFTFLSYRDPNLKNTLDIYESSADAISTADIDSADILQAVVGTMGDLDSPMSPDQKGFTSFLQYLSGETQKDRQDWRTSILTTKGEDFKDFAEKLRKLKDTGSIAVFGSMSALEDANKQLPEGSKMKIEQAITSTKEN